jgi:hypothetical protein
MIHSCKRTVSSSHSVQEAQIQTQHIFSPADQESEPRLSSSLRVYTVQNKQPFHEPVNWGAEARISDWGQLTLPINHQGFYKHNISRNKQ